MKKKLIYVLILCFSFQIHSYAQEANYEPPFVVSKRYDEFTQEFSAQSRYFKLGKDTTFYQTEFWISRINDNYYICFIVKRKNELRNSRSASGYPLNYVTFLFHDNSVLKLHKDIGLGRISIYELPVDQFRFKAVKKIRISRVDMLSPLDLDWVCEYSMRELLNVMSKLEF